MSLRAVSQVVVGHPAVDGAGVSLTRVLGSRTVRDFDPFLLLDAFDSTDPDDYIRGFPMHPHRGIETVTYLIRGRIEHQDSLGNKGAITDGACQWMTAGGGILHQEMPKTSPRMLGLQFWVNMPAAQKMAPPKYRDITPEMIPALREDGATVKVLCGEFQGTAGAMRADHVKAVFLDLDLEPGREWFYETNPDHTLFVYIFEGTCSFEPDGQKLYRTKQAVLMGVGDKLRVSAPPDSGARMILVSGPPLREPVEWGGPIVMNTPEQLRQAFQELEDGTFIKNDGAFPL